MPAANSVSIRTDAIKIHVMETIRLFTVGLSCMFLTRVTGSLTG